MHEISLEKYNLRTDLIIEREDVNGSKKESIIDKTYKVERIEANDEKYISISFEDITDKDNFKIIENTLIKELKLILKDYQIKKEDLVLIIGLGNSLSTPDSLGPKTLENILVTSYLYNLGEVDSSYQNTAIFKPEVTGTTGIETSTIIKTLIEKTNTKLVIFIDALAASTLNHLNKVIQITSSGISPGSGVGNNREELTRKTLNIPVIAIGVPTIVEASTIVKDTLINLKKHISYQIDNKDNIKTKLTTYQDYSNQENTLSKQEEKNILGEIGLLEPLDLKQLIDEVLIPIKYNLMVTPKEIDFQIEKLSLLIANSLNKSLHDNFNPTK